MPKSSSFLFITIFIYLLLTFISYAFISKYIESTNLKAQEVLFYKIQNETNNLLTKLLYKYTLQKNEIEQKHKVVLKYLEGKTYDINLDEIYEKINKNLPNKPYNIYITDENLIVKNTTYKSDLSLDLSFAKDVFEEHKLNNEIGVSLPIFEIYNNEFLSYSDSYLPNSKQILQISYTYFELNNLLEELKNILNKNFEIESSNTFIVYNDGYIGDFIFKLPSEKINSTKDIEDRIQNGKKLLKNIKEDDYLTSFQVKTDKKNIKYLNIVQKSSIFDDAKVLYSIAFDENNYFNDLKKLKITTILLTFIGIIAIFIIAKVRNKEKLLNYKDKFIEHSIHEIKTPLSIISINSQLRDKFFGEDKYSIKLKGALRTLENSYEDMTFLHTKEQIVYKIENLNIKDILLDRVDYFKIIAKTQNRKFELDIFDDFYINISKVELHRFIDNNLSNAIKYSFIGSSIKVILENNILKFISNGNNIKNSKNIFKKYVRENNDVGGHGLGLSIISDICKKYEIKILVNSQNNQNIFEYKLN